MMSQAQLMRQEECSSPVTWRQIGVRLVFGIALPTVVFVLFFWDLIFFTQSWIVLPGNDFGRMYASADLFMHGGDMYAWNRATPAWLESNYTLDLYNMNPPHFHLILLPLTLLPAPDYAFVVWWACSGLCLVYCLRRAMNEVGGHLSPMARQLGILFVLAFAGTTAMLYTGQLSFVLLVPLTWMWLLARRGQWVGAGALLGVALSVKPFLAVLLVYLCWHRRWRAAAACLLSCAACFGLGLLVFGWQNHLSWVACMRRSQAWAWLPMNASLLAALTRTFTESIWYVPLVTLSSRAVWLLWVGVGGALGLLTLAATRMDGRPETADQDFSLLLLSSVLFCPLGWVYYLWLAVPPFVALLAGGWGARLRGDGPQPRRWPWVLLGVTVVAFTWPVVCTRLGQPEYLGERRTQFMAPLSEDRLMLAEAFATLTIGNMYFWGLFCLWICLVRSGLRRTPTMALAPLAAAEMRVSVVMPVFAETDTVRAIALWLLRELDDRLHEIVIVQSPRSGPESAPSAGGWPRSIPRYASTRSATIPGWAAASAKDSAS